MQVPHGHQPPGTLRPRETEPKRHRKRGIGAGVWIARTFCVVFAILGLLPIVAAAIVRTNFARAWAAREASRVLREELGLDATFQAAVQPWPLAILVRDVVVDSTNGTGPALNISQIALRPRIFSLLQGRLNAGDIEIETPHIRLDVRDGKLVNLVLRPREHPPAPPSNDTPFASLAINGASIDLTIDGTHAQAEQIDLDVTAEEKGAFDVALRSSGMLIERTSRLSFTGPGVPEPTNAQHQDVVCSLDARARIDSSSVLIRRLRLLGAADLDPAVDTKPSCALNPGDLHRVELELRHLAATFDDDGLKTATGHVQARAPLRIANRFFSFLPLKGWIGADTDGSWERGRALPDVRGKVSGGGIAVGGYGVASELQAEVRVQNGVVHAPSVEVGFADGIVRMRDVEVKPLEPGIPIDATAVMLDRLQFPGLMRDLDVTPRTHVRMLLNDGALTAVHGTIDPLHIDTELVIHVSDFEVFGSVFDDPGRKHMIGVKQGTVRSKFVFRPNAVEFHSAQLDFGSSHLNVSCSLGFTNEFRLNVTEGSTLSFEDVSPLIDIPWKGKAELTAGITGLFSEPLNEGSLAIKGFEFAQLAFGDVRSAKAKFRPLVIDLSNVKVEKGKSKYEASSLRLDFNGPAPVVADALIDATTLDVRDFLSVFHLENDPRFLAIAGTGKAKATLRFEQGGPHDVCGGGWLGMRASAQVKPLGLFGENYEEGEADLDYEWLDHDAQEQGIRAVIRSFVLRKGGGTIVGAGSIEPGGILRVQAAANDIPLRSLQAFGKKLGDKLDASVSATADVRGTLDRIEAQVDVRVGPLKVGDDALPASAIAVHLVPIDPPVRVTGRTQCGHLISAPFNPGEFKQDRPSGMFDISGQVFGGQILLQGLQVTQQQHKQLTGRIEARSLELGKLARLVTGLEQSKDYARGTLGGVLDVAHLEFDALDRTDASLVLNELSVQRPEGTVSLRQGTPPLLLREDVLNLPAIPLDFASPNGLSATFIASGRVLGVTTSPTLELSAKLLPTDLQELANAVQGIERARGVVQAALEIRGPASAPVYKGELVLEHGALTLRGLPVSLEDADIRIALSEREIRLEHATAKVGGGQVQIAGNLPVRGFDFGTATAQLIARNVSMPVIDGVAMTLDADLTASWSARVDEAVRNVPRVVGDVTLVSFEYKRPITLDAEIGALAQHGKRTQFEVYDPAEDAVDFEVRLHATQPLRFRNNLADLQLSLDSSALTLSGSNQRAGLRGALRVQPGGRVRLRRNEFEVRDGVVQFDDITRIAPSIDVTAVTEYRRYAKSQSTATGAVGGTSGVSRAGGQWRIQLHAHGDSDNLRIDLSSEPSLSQEDIVLLLTLGMTRAELDQMQAASLGETAALEALSTLTGADDVVRQTIPVIDDFRLGSAYSSRSGRTEPTVTVGKRVTERLRANVTSGLSESREVRSNLEWELTGSTSVMGSYDNVNNVSNSSVGNLGADVRFRMTFE